MNLYTVWLKNIGCVGVFNDLTLAKQFSENQAGHNRSVEIRGMLMNLPFKQKILFFANDSTDFKLRRATIEWDI